VSVNKEKSKIVVQVRSIACQIEPEVCQGTDYGEQAEGAFSKRYLKYLAKKYLKKHQV
jgi:hypothetical protein